MSPRLPQHNEVDFEGFERFGAYDLGTFGYYKDFLLCVCVCVCVCFGVSGSSNNARTGCPRTPVGDSAFGLFGFHGRSNTFRMWIFGLLG